MDNMSAQATPESVWEAFRETDRKIKELAERQAETDRQMKETDRKIAAVTASQAKTDLQMAATDRKIATVSSRKCSGKT